MPLLYSLAAAAARYTVNDYRPPDHPVTGRQQRTVDVQAIELRTPVDEVVDACRGPDRHVCGVSCRYRPIIGFRQPRRAALNYRAWQYHEAEVVKLPRGVLRHL